MPDPLVVVTVAVLAIILAVLLVARMSQVIRPGQVGLVFLLGAYRGALRPGFSLVSPIAMVYRVVAGSGTNQLLGLVGTAATNLSTEGLPGRVKIGDREISARSVGHITAGSPVRVVGDTAPGLVLVAAELQVHGPGSQS